MKSILALAAIALLVPTVGHASEKYVCSLSPNNGIGVGIEIQIEVLGPDSANYQGFQTSQSGLKVPPPIRVENPGKLTRNGDILHLENVVHTIPPKVENAPPEITDVAAIEIDLSKMQLSFPKANRPGSTIPCVVSK